MSIKRNFLHHNVRFSIKIWRIISRQVLVATHETYILYILNVLNVSNVLTLHTMKIYRYYVFILYYIIITYLLRYIFLSLLIPKTRFNQTITYAYKFRRRSIFPSLRSGLLLSMHEEISRSYRGTNRLDKTPINLNLTPRSVALLDIEEIDRRSCRSVFNHLRWQLIANHNE